MELIDAMPEQPYRRPRDLHQAAKRLRVIANQLDALEGDWQLNESILAEFESRRPDRPDLALRQERLELKTAMQVCIGTKGEELLQLAGVITAMKGHPPEMTASEGDSFRDLYESQTGNYPLKGK